MSTWIRFVSDAEERDSGQLGPFADVAISFGALRVRRHDSKCFENLARFDGGVWEHKGRRYSDVAMTHVDKDSLLSCLATVIDCANSHVEDIETGLEDGTYDKADNQDLGEKQRALKVVESWFHAEAGTAKMKEGAPCETTGA